MTPSDADRSAARDLLLGLAMSPSVKPYGQVAAEDIAKAIATARAAGAEKEREACAKIADDYSHQRHGGYECCAPLDNMGIAAVIRARGGTGGA